MCHVSNKSVFPVYFQNCFYYGDFLLDVILIVEDYLILTFLKRKKSKFMINKIRYELQN